jgi:hypothetical protein
MIAVKKVPISSVIYCISHVMALALKLPTTLLLHDSTISRSEED